MTSLIAWISVDTHGPAAAYLASDSRLTFGGGASWDAGRKLFTARRSADLLGYCGQVLFPSLLLGQVCGRLDASASNPDFADPGMRHAAIVNVMESAFGTYPQQLRQPLSITHIGRRSEGKSARFRVWRTDWTAAYGWNDVEIEVPKSSALLLALGSGSPTVAEHHDLWAASSAGGTSRAVFGSFCDALRSGTDPKSGGPPQLAGLYRKGHGMDFGTISNRERSFTGLPVDEVESRRLNVEWRNERFERCDGVSMARLSDAQPHPGPWD